MKNSKLKIASFSDVHLGHPNTPAKFIIDNIDKAFPDNEVTGELDMIVIVGDLFDRGINYFSNDVSDIQSWSTYFMSMCRRRNIVLRILEGTRSHDRRQSYNLISMHDAFMKSQGLEPGNIRYVENLEIEFIPELGINVLYVPDDLNPDTDVIWQQVQQLLSTEGLEQVDITLLHGSFSHQLPEFVTAPKHDPDRYESISKLAVFAGHIHIPSQRGKIFCNGSFDRLTHNEEGDKGHWRAEFRSNGDYKFEFVVNQGAKKYVSIDLRGLSVEECIENCKSIAHLPAGSFVRVIAEEGADILANIDMLRKAYPTYRWTSKIEDAREVQSNLLVDLRETFHEVEITPSNIRQLIGEWMKNKGIPDERSDKALTMFEEFMNE